MSASFTDKKFEEALELACRRYMSIENLYENLHQEQKVAMRKLLGGNDIFFSAPTGFGKSLIFQILPIMTDIILDQLPGTSTVIVISPLKSLMIDQVSFLNKETGITAIALTDTNEMESDELFEHITEDCISLIYASPETLLSIKRWRTIASSPAFRKNCVGLIIDEAHCLIHWGTSLDSNAPFRHWYGKLVELKSLILEKTPVGVFTATATKETKNNTIMRLLSVVVLCVAALHCTDALALKTCERDFKKIGCYDEYYAKKGDLIFSQRDEVLWGDIAAFMHHLACRCNEEVKKKNEKRATTGKEAYVGFALHYWGECFGKTKSQTDALMDKDKSHRCTGSQDYAGCADEHAECVGHANADPNPTVLFPPFRERTCTNPVPKGKGKDCSDLGNSTEIGACDTGKPCPVDGEYGPWKNFGACTKSCGGGNQTRTRPCNNPAPSHGGKECEGPASESRPCNVESCPVDGKYGPWGSFGLCSTTCGGGVKRRTRSCTNPSPSHGGKECKGAALETLSCNTQNCPDVDGGFAEWGGWTKCQSECGPGIRIRERTCTNPEPQGEGKDCSSLGESTQSQPCMSKACPVDGGFSSWSTYGTCSKSCAGGVQERTRSCTNPAPANGGKNCDGGTEQTRVCNPAPCPVHGGWSQWTSFDMCTKRCGGGKQKRIRGCTNPPPMYGGNDCVGKSVETKNCNESPCPVHGGYTAWTGYGSCSKSCGGGSQYRSRTCTNPRPAHGGRNCDAFGPRTEARPCNQQACPIKEYSKTCCEGHSIVASCSGSDRISIRYAMYGRRNKSTCKNWLTWAMRTDCSAGNAYNKVKSACNGQRSCRIYAKNSMFGDPCWGTTKYLKVTYRCQ
eukprot:gene14506-5566_t